MASQDWSLCLLNETGKTAADGMFAGSGSNNNQNEIIFYICKEMVMAFAIYELPCKRDYDAYRIFK